MSDPKKAWLALFGEVEVPDQDRLRREAKLKAKRKLARKRTRKSRGLTLRVANVPPGSQVTVIVTTPPAHCTCSKRQAEEFENNGRWWAYARPRRLPC